MSISKKFYSLVVAGLLAFSSASHATTTVYDFGTLVGDGYLGAPTTASFAQLSATDTGSGVWNFMLSIDNSLFTLFQNSGAFISTLSFDFAPNPVGPIVSTLNSSTVAGVTSVSTTSGAGGSGTGLNFDFGTKFGQGFHNRLIGNESVNWSVSGLTNGINSNSLNLSNLLIHVQGAGLDGKQSAKYVPIVSPIPEPETYAMLLAGLGLIGFSARRRKLNN